MAVVRISIMRPVPGRRQEVERLLQELEAWVSSQPGYLFGVQLSSFDHTGEVGRIAVYNSREDANRMATMDHTVAIRSQLHDAIMAGHTESMFEVTAASKMLNIPGVPAALAKAKSGNKKG